MDFNQFVDEVKGRIKQFLPIEYEDAQVKIEEIKKLNENYLGITVVVVKHFCNTLFENSPGISSFKWCFPIIVGMRTDMIVPYVHISV